MKPGAKDMETLTPGSDVLISVSRFTFRQLLSKMRDGENMDDTVRRLIGLNDREPRLLKIALIESMVIGETMCIPWEERAPKASIRSSVHDCCHAIAIKHNRTFKLKTRIDGVAIVRTS